MPYTYLKVSWHWTTLKAQIECVAKFLSIDTILCIYLLLLPFGCCCCCFSDQLPKFYLSFISSINWSLKWKVLCVSLVRSIERSFVCSLDDLKFHYVFSFQFSDFGFHFFYSLFSFFVPYQQNGKSYAVSSSVAPKSSCSLNEILTHTHTHTWVESYSV